MIIALASLAACLVGTVLVAVLDHPAPPEPIRVPVHARASVAKRVSR
jgi:hypothetical protein